MPHRPGRHLREYEYTVCVYNSDKELVYKETSWETEASKAIHSAYCDVIGKANDGQYHIFAYNKDGEMVGSDLIPKVQNFTFTWYSDDMSQTLKEVTIRCRDFQRAEAEFREMVHKEIGYVSFNYTGVDESGKVLHDEVHPVKDITLEVYDGKKFLGSYTYQALDSSTAYHQFLKEHPFPDKDIDVRIYHEHSITGEVDWLPFSSRRAEETRTGELDILIFRDGELERWQEQKMNDFLTAKNEEPSAENDTALEEKEDDQEL